MAEWREEGKADIVPGVRKMKLMVIRTDDNLFYVSGFSPAEQLN